METTYTKARANLAKLCDKVADDNQIVYITRRNSSDVALISAIELSSILETAHLLRSPKNSQRLFNALKSVKSRSVKPLKIEALKKIVKL